MSKVYITSKIVANSNMFFHSVDVMHESPLTLQPYLELLQSLFQLPSLLSLPSHADCLLLGPLTQQSSRVCLSQALHNHYLHIFCLFIVKQQIILVHGIKLPLPPYKHLPQHGKFIPTFDFNITIHFSDVKVKKYIAMNSLNAGSTIELNIKSNYFVS